MFSVNVNVSEVYIWNSLSRSHYKTTDKTVNLKWHTAQLANSSNTSIDHIHVAVKTISCRAWGGFERLYNYKIYLDMLSLMLDESLFYFRPLRGSLSYETYNDVIHS